MTCINHDQVSAKLHALRGEAFRRQVNLTGKGRHRGRSSVLDLDRGPSLPPGLHSSEVSLPSETSPDVSLNSDASKTPGPPPPRSWIVSSATNPADPMHSEWRSRALSFIFHRSSRSSQFHSLHSDPAASSISSVGVPSFFRLCLHAILTRFGGIPSNMHPHIPRHILREYVRYSVVHRPLSKEDSLAIWSLDGINSVDGELLVTGHVTTSALSLSQRTPSSDIVTENWDAEDTDSERRDIPIPMHTFIALSASFNSSHIALLPASITHLALLNIPKTPLYTLPHQLPRLVVLDLSYNPWISETHALRVDWRAWEDLEAVSLRGCSIGEGGMKGVKENIRKGRLLDVEIIIIGP